MPRHGGKPGHGDVATDEELWRSEVLWRRSIGLRRTEPPRREACDGSVRFAAPTPGGDRRMIAKGELTMTYGNKPLIIWTALAGAFLVSVSVALGGICDGISPASSSPLATVRITTN